jgi:hypothetical protein
MKKILYASALLSLLLTVSYVIWGCEDDTDISDSRYLTKSASHEVNLGVMREAVNRFDPYVEFHDGKFMYRAVTAAELAMSEEVFLQLCEMIKMSNEAIKGKDVVEFKRNVLKGISEKDDPLVGIRLKGLEENPLPPNSTGVDMRWYGIDIYLSTSYLKAIKYTAEGGVILGGIVSFFVKPVLLAVVVAQICEYLANAALETCDQGLVVEYYWVIGVAGSHCQ